MAVRAAAGLALRPLRTADLAAVLAIQRAAYGDDYQETAVVLARKLALAPRACWLAQAEGAAVGYVFAHPWGDVGAPPLHAPLAALPAQAGQGFLHDLAVLPAARGRGVAAALFGRVRDWSAGAGHRGLRLVALADAVPFWARQGFSALPAMLPAGYGEGARLMARALRA
ncbi:GNAT family N-acetyltransferase [Thauera sp.]|jgi:GNAT superfamily N-acetyltransferase|uniref:GNAT family N-acetyltransferase n=1 Tax=Thauera sp. TaxID=1905334 RepID=UPI00261B167B|nr:GNAT family N-acetyltransferase [Thauera sp.]MCK6407865.1 GNAT family N-acetyltransferase [Thauera sp.]